MPSSLKKTEKKIYPESYSIEEEVHKQNSNKTTIVKEVPQSYKKYEKVDYSELVLDETTGRLEEKPLKSTLTFVPPDLPTMPFLDPRDDHLPQLVNEKVIFYRKMLHNLVESFKEKKYIFIEGEKLKEILKNLWRAKEEDFPPLQDVCDNMNNDPFLHYRKGSKYELIFNLDLKNAYRATRKPFILDVKDGYKRDDSGIHRFFGETQDWTLQNTAFQALQSFKAYMISNTKDLVHLKPGCDDSRNWRQSGNFARVSSAPGVFSNPTPEGVHQDGCEFTMTTLFKSLNIDFEKGAVKSTLLSLSQEIGTKYNEVESKNIIDVVQHKNFLDTLLFADYELAHVVSPFHPIDNSSISHRDMGIFFTRRLSKKEEANDDVCFLFDGEEAHQELPCSFTIHSKYLQIPVPKNPEPNRSG